MLTVKARLTPSYVTQLQKYGDILADNLPLYLVLYFSCAVVIRYLMCPNIGWFDEAEVAISTTHWSWLYHPTNPPLYHWLLLGVYKIFGIHSLSHLILKNFLTGVAIYSLYQAGLKTFGDRLLGLCLGLSPLLIKDWGIWGPFKFTHSNLLITAMAVTFWQLVRFIHQPNMFNALLLGSVMALGCLSKYNYVFFALPCLAALFGPWILKRHFSPFLLIGVVLPVLALGGIHLYQGMKIYHLYDLSDLIARKFKEPPHAYLILTILDQCRLVITQIFEQTFPLNLALGATLLMGRGHLKMPKAALGRFFIWQQIFAFVSLAGMVLGLGIISQPKRYILPFILSIPFVTFALLPRLMALRGTIAVIFASLWVVREVWVFSLLLLFSHVPLNGEENLILPQGDYPSLARIIEQEHKSILVTDDLIAAGNLKFYLPTMTIYKIGYNDFWLNSKDGKAYNQLQIVYLCAKKQCSGKINLPMVIKEVSLPLKGGEKKYELMTLK